MMSGVALFVDYENLQRSMRYSTPDLKIILKYAERHGRVIIRRVYLINASKSLIDAAQKAGYELVLIPHHHWKPNLVDINMIVDLVDKGSLSLVETVVVVSGDSDFEPAVRKLREKGKTVLLLAVKSSVSEVLKASVDAFLPYEELMEASLELSVTTPVVVK